MNFTDIMNDFLSNYASEIIFGIFTTIASCLGVIVKNIYNKCVNDQTKKSVIKTVVQAVNQLYTELHGEDKYNKAVELATNMLKEKGIKITELEIKMLIEASVNEFNNSFVSIGELATMDEKDMEEE